MVTYYSETQYLETATSLQDKIVKIDAILLKMYDALVKAAMKDYIQEYTLDNGQTKINTIYRGVESVQKGIDGLEKSKQILIARLQRNQNGSIIRLVDSKNINGRNGF